MAENAPAELPAGPAPDGPGMFARLRIGSHGDIMLAIGIMAILSVWDDWTTWIWWERLWRLLAVVGAGGIAYVAALVAQGIRPGDLRH